MILQYVQPDGACTPVDKTLSSELWRTICSDEAYEWGLTSNSWGALQWTADDTIIKQLFFSKHPDALWYLEYEDYDKKRFLAIFDPNSNDDSWADSYMNRDSVCALDESDNVYVKLSIGGAEQHVLHACFVGANVAERVFLEFCATGMPSRDENWIESSSVNSRIHVG